MGSGVVVVGMGGISPAAFWARGRIDPGEVTSLSQWQTQRQIIIHGQVKLASSPIPRIPVFGLGEEAGIPCRTFKHHTAKPLAPRGFEQC